MTVNRGLDEEDHQKYHKIMLDNELSIRQT